MAGVLSAGVDAVAAAHERDHGRTAMVPAELEPPALDARAQRSERRIATGRHDEKDDDLGEPHGTIVVNP
jgi:hypothetical protein